MVKSAARSADGNGDSTRGRRDGEFRVTETVARSEARPVAEDSLGPLEISVAPVRPALRERLLRRRPEGLPWWFEFVLLYGLYSLYSLIRNSVGDVRAVAFGNAESILRFEDAWHLSIERGLNEWVHGSDVLAGMVALHYATLHFWITPAVLIWLYRRRREAYRVASTIWMGTTGLALVGFYLTPTAPPRLMRGEGFVDVMSQTSSWGWWPASGAPASDAISNQFAAMPSLHCAWAAWCGIVVFVLVRRVWVRILAFLYPLSTFFVVMGSGNHFLLDVVAGVALLALVAAAVFIGARQVRNRRIPVAVE
jgi:hypothetical protein